MWEVHQATELLRVPLDMIGARNAIYNFFEDNHALDLLREPLVAIIAALNAIERKFSPKPWICCESRLSRYWCEKCE